MNSKITFITGNQSKADYLVRYLGFPVKHQKLDLDEIQSLDLKEIVTHKAKQAFAKIHSPILVEDTSLEFVAFGRLPGPFIRYFIEDMGFDDICNLLNGKDRSAIARSVFGYYDGKNLTAFEGSMKGEIATDPCGNGGFGWDKIFIPEGYSVTRAQMNEDDDRKTYLQIKPFEQLKQFLDQL